MYKHLSREERYQIQSLVRAQHTTTEIARLLGRHPSTISREIKRGRGLKGYRPNMPLGGFTPKQRLAMAA